MLRSVRAAYLVTTSLVRNRKSFAQKITARGKPKGNRKRRIPRLFVTLYTATQFRNSGLYTRVYYIYIYLINRRTFIRSDSSVSHVTCKRVRASGTFSYRIVSVCPYRRRTYRYKCNDISSEAAWIWLKNEKYSRTCFYSFYNKTFLTYSNNFSYIFLYSVIFQGSFGSFLF